jgi:hypothetical protein
VRFDDPALVRREYANEDRLAARRAVFTWLVEGRQTLFVAHKAA